MNKVREMFTDVQYRVSQGRGWGQSWSNTNSAWAGWSRFDIPVERYGGVHSLLLCTSITLGSSTCQQPSQQGNTYWAKYQKAGQGQRSMYSVGIHSAAPIPLPCCTLCCTDVQFTNFVHELLVNIALGEHSKYTVRIVDMYSTGGQTVLSAALYLLTNCLLLRVQLCCTCSLFVHYVCTHSSSLLYRLHISTVNKYTLSIQLCLY